MTRITARNMGLAGLGLALLAGCGALPASAPADQAVPMAFQQCLARIDETAARIGQDPAMLAETSDSRIVRFRDGEEIVTVTCDAIGNQMVVQTRPAPAPLPGAAPLPASGPEPDPAPGF
ncbi:hypothetical protein [Limimaricola hongkongensis]|uniref:Lipoprotein n=1 Tax=Limimaricola hongkongensis DSM 17492 TaxID=1122180 RepID=A0A017HFJ7_9RHOB|nr:hypothetical protein [Limimaricola hongkongensis]EYD73060.1 hypothetical protein Lokhon_00585 [Limimaricola hongkongensis DSM 17492]